jgi:hypothetical protein
MEGAVTTKPTGQSWRLLAFALAAFIFLPFGLQIVVPILQTSLLLAPIIAVCAVIGWLAGSRPYLAIVWVALAVWLLVAPMGRAGSPYEGMARGWALLLAGCFGLLSLWSSATPFIVRALGALGLAIGAAFALAISSPGGIDRYVKVSASEFSARGATLIAAFEVERQKPLYRGYAARVPEMDAFYDRLETRIRQMPAVSAVLLPALLALESLAALALGWAVYARLDPNSIGPSLSPLREFRFSDQLVWGVAVGGTLLLLPAFEEGRNAGLNLLVFFGALYLIRGMAVVAWMSRRRGLLIASAILVFFVPPLFRLIIAGLIGIGLGDTWLDWRSRPTAA